MIRNNPLLYYLMIFLGIVTVFICYQSISFVVNRPGYGNITRVYGFRKYLTAQVPSLKLTTILKTMAINPIVSPRLGMIPSYPIFSQRLSQPIDEFIVADETTNSPRVILFWTPLFGNADWLLGSMGHEPFVKLKCPISNCLVTGDRERLSEADAVLVNFRDDFNYKDRPSTENRKPNQLWTFVLWESPEHTYHYVWQENRQMTKELKTFEKFFNWTMTYRLDSDIPFNYGNFIPLKTPDFSRAGFDRLNNKKKSIIWMNSHCSTPSKRESYIAALSKHLDVDIIGDGCGISRPNQVTSNVCRKNGFFNGIDTRCLQYISKTYKFYLAFENSLCRDYVTEKLYRAARMDLIPVVYNGANMSLFAPNHSYIDANAFSSPEALAEYLKKVGSDSKLYNSYFWWKPYYDVNLILFNDEKGFDGQHFCDLCAKVNQVLFNKNIRAVKVYEDIHNWWTVEGNCTNGYEES